VQFDATVRFTVNGDGTGTLTTSGCDNVTYGITFGDAQTFVIGAINGNASVCANPFDGVNASPASSIPSNECRGKQPVTHSC
jgi:hypothetical protein